MIDKIISYICDINRTYQIYKDDLYEAVCSIPELFRTMSEN